MMKGVTRVSVVTALLLFIKHRQNIYPTALYIRAVASVLYIVHRVGM